MSKVSDSFWMIILVFSLLFLMMDITSFLESSFGVKAEPQLIDKIIALLFRITDILQTAALYFLVFKMSVLSQRFWFAALVASISLTVIDVYQHYSIMSFAFLALGIPFLVTQLVGMAKYTFTAFKVDNEQLG